MSKTLIGQYETHIIVTLYTMVIIARQRKRRGTKFGHEAKE